MALACAALAAGPGLACAQVDSLRARVEAGVGYDLTNEIYFDQPFDSTAIVPRIKVSDTDGRLLGIGAAHLDLHYAGRSRFSVDQLAQAGTDLAREQLRLDWRHATATDWRWLGGGGVDYRHDTSFDEERNDFQGDARFGVERAPPDFASSLRALYRFDAGTSRVTGGTPIYPDFFYHRLSLGASRFGDLGSEWGAEYTAGYRTFPDTSVRNYFDHTGEVYGRARLGNGAELSLRGWGQRRAARSDSAFGDRFWQGDAEVSYRQPLSLETWWLTIAGHFFGTAYDQPTGSFFHNALWRESAELRYEAGAAWAAQIKAELEELRVPSDGGLSGEDALNARREEYDQARLELGLERLGETTIFFEPAAGRRVYRIQTSDPNDLLARSSYWFVGANGYADARLAARVRLRASLDYLYEFHDVAADDLSAVYLTAELRYALGR